MADLLSILQSLRANPAMAAVGGGMAGAVPQAPPMVNRNPLQTALGVQPPSAGNAQPSYDFSGGQQGPDMNNPYVPEIQKLLEEIRKKNEALTKTALAASAHQAQAPQQNPNPIRPGANMLALLLAGIGESVEKGAGVKGYQAFTGAAQQTEAGRVQNEMLKHQGEGARMQGQMQAGSIEKEGLEDQRKALMDLSRMWQDDLQQKALDSYRTLQQEGLNERASMQGALREMDLQIKQLKLNQEIEAFNKVKLPESGKKIQKMDAEIDLAAERAKTEIKRRAKFDADIKGVLSRSKLNDSQRALVDKKASLYDDEFRLRAANVYSQIAKRSSDAKKGTTPKPESPPSLNQQRLLLQSVISIGKAQLKRLEGSSKPDDQLRIAEILTDVQEAEKAMIDLAKNAAKKAAPKPLSGSLDGQTKGGNRILRSGPAK